MKSLDQAMGPAADDIGEVRPPKRQQTSRSIYSTLAKYGIGSKDSVASKKSYVYLYVCDMHQVPY
jgi:hypothetical protein